MKNGIFFRILCLSLALSTTFLITPTPGYAASRADWTVAFYMSSDNGLDSWAQRDVGEIMLVGSSNNVNILLFWDKESDVSSAYKVNKNNLLELFDFKYDGIEPNMGNPETLRSFVTYALKNFPANKFALVLWDHGDDF